jgi:hypothetical protein
LLVALSDAAGTELLRVMVVLSGKAGCCCAGPASIPQPSEKCWRSPKDSAAGYAEMNIQ